FPCPLPRSFPPTPPSHSSMTTATLAPAVLHSLQASSSPAALALATSAGRWHMAPHLALLNRLVLRLARRDLRRVLVTVPVRHGKSSFLSRYTVAWRLAHFKQQKIILA